MKNNKNLLQATNDNHLRNRKKRIVIASNNHPVIKLINKVKIKPKKVLEIGCSTGFVLKRIKDLLKAKCDGIDLSSKAIKEGKMLFKDINLYQGLFENSKLRKKKYDLIVFGFFLFLVKIEDILKIFYWANRSLNKNKFIIIYDFYNSKFVKKNYKHHNKIKVYRYDYKKIFLSLPNYKLVKKIKIFDKNMNDYVEVSLLKKLPID